MKIILTQEVTGLGQPGDLLGEDELHRLRLS